MNCPINKQINNHIYQEDIENREYEWKQEWLDTKSKECLDYFIKHGYIWFNDITRYHTCLNYCKNIDGSINYSKKCIYEFFELIEHIDQHQTDQINNFIFLSINEINDENFQDLMQEIIKSHLDEDKAYEEYSYEKHCNKYGL